VSCPELDQAVDIVLAAGAIGTRMTEGGFGGSVVALMPEQDVDRITAAITSGFPGPRLPESPGPTRAGASDATADARP
jgi:galactokinase